MPQDNPKSKPHPHMKVLCTTIRKIKTPAQYKGFRVSMAHEEKIQWFVFLIRVMF